MSPSKGRPSGHRWACACPMRVGFSEALARACVCTCSATRVKSSRQPRCDHLVKKWRYIVWGGCL
eukprot:4369779-Alexandrium_andersonii.AAC.1